MSSRCNAPPNCLVFSIRRRPDFCIDVGSSCLCRFLIGREKDGVESEVAQLINESLEKEKMTEMVCSCVPNSFGSTGGTT